MACKLFPYPSARSGSALILMTLITVLLVAALSGCSGGKGGSMPSPSNVGGGFTLVASGGTLDDGSGVNGLAVLVTLRDESGNGPAIPWTLSITGPGFAAPLSISYDDGSPSSYMAWWWDSFDPQPGRYTATATNGATVLTYAFEINTTTINLSQPTLNKSGSIISWNTVPGAGSYYYEMTDGSHALPITSGYFESDPLVSQYSFSIPTLENGSYLVSVYALTNNRFTLSSDSASWPSLPVQNNDSLATIDFVQGGTGSGYVLDARGGVLYEGLYSAGSETPADYYGIVIWTSIVTTSTPSTAPAGDWNLTVTGPGITTALTFSYPRTDSHYIWWDFGTIPAPGTYTVTATPAAGGSSLIQTFTVPSPTAKLPVATGLSATPSNGGGAALNWNTVAGANSYYVNIWTCVGTGSVNTETGCTNEGTYSEIAGGWSNSTSLTISNGSLTKGLVYDLYVTASELDMMDMNSVPVPVSPGSQVNMSDTTFTYTTFTAL